ncbi:MAG: hypothetical protein ALECFALPRED_004369 [Alectoria fallacina]|uniref:Uncharacterized protein n=1 Tax=Alectoria fallacina TaxID=1903189 RepID=A0A8H3EKB7_9LECA|nr:MAG: hypothetical protein ALECFALPRED_004369 [Alectoria fallacina]
MGNNPSHHAALFGGVPSRERQAWVRPKPPGSKRKQSRHPQSRGQYSPGPAPPELDRYPPMQGHNEEPAPYGYPPAPPDPGNHGPPIHHGADYPPQTPRGNHQHGPSYDNGASEEEQYMPAPSASDRFTDPLLNLVHLVFRLVRRVLRLNIDL